MERRGRSFPLHTATVFTKTPKPPFPCSPRLPAPSSSCTALLAPSSCQALLPCLGPEPCSHLAFPFASSHPSLREWSLALLCQIHQKGLLTTPSGTPKSWKLGEKGSEIGITSKLPGDSQVYRSLRSGVESAFGTIWILVFEARFTGASCTKHDGLWVKIPLLGMPHSERGHGVVAPRLTPISG